jgi:hypothetical protein
MLCFFPELVGDAGRFDGWSEPATSFGPFRAAKSFRREPANPAGPSLAANFSPFAQISHRQNQKTRPDCRKSLHGKGFLEAACGRSNLRTSGL